MTGSLRVDKGKYYAVINLKDEAGKRKQKVVNLQLSDVPGNKRKAQKALRDVLKTYEDTQTTVYRQDILFCDYLKIWLEEAKPKLELTTYESYESYLDLHLYPYFKQLNVTIQALKYQQIQKYYDEKRKTLSANSLKKHHVAINQTLRKALKNDLIPHNPADKVTLPKVERYVGKFLTVEQGNELLEVSKGTPMETPIILAMMYGLRRSEIAGLKWRAVDFENGTITICHTVTKMKTTVRKDRTKNKSSNRIMPLNQEVKAHLLALRDQQQRERKLLGRGYQDTEYVCRWPDGRALRCDYMSMAFRKLLAKHGLPPIRLHDLRHSCASYMLKMGCSMKEVADWLGHADIKTAMNVYAHLDMEQKQNVADKFGALLTV